jgi:hypothetical protein
VNNEVSEPVELVVIGYPGETIAQRRAVTAGMGQ